MLKGFAVAVVCIGILVTVDYQVYNGVYRTRRCRCCGRSATHSGTEALTLRIAPHLAHRPLCLCTVCNDRTLFLRDVAVELATAGHTAAMVNHSATAVARMICSRRAPSKGYPIRGSQPTLRT